MPLVNGYCFVCKRAFHSPWHRRYSNNVGGRVCRCGRGTAGDLKCRTGITVEITQTKNIWKSFRVVTKLAADSTLVKIMRMAEEVQAEKRECRIRRKG